MGIEKSRKSFLDLLRIIACFLVIVNHTNSVIFLNTAPKNPTWFISLTYFFISKIAVPIFFMISGYLLLNKKDSPKKSLQRFIRIAVVLIACGFIYAVYNTCGENPNPSFLTIIKTTLSTYYRSPTNALWYLYTYLGVLLMLPFLQKMTFLMTKRDYHIFFVVSVTCFSILPILTHYFPQIRLSSDFQLPLFGGYICMLLIGKYFSRFEIKKTKFRFLVSCVLFVMMLAFNVIATYFEHIKANSDYLFFDNRVFFPILLQSVCVFYMASFIRFSEKSEKIISYIGSCTFGIFLISDMNISFLKPIYLTASTYMHPIFAVIIFEVIVFVVGFVVVALLKKIPLIRKVL